MNAAAAQRRGARPKRERTLTVRAVAMLIAALFSMPRAQQELERRHPNAALALPCGKFGDKDPLR
jgi:hypothetical protein